LAVGVRSRPNLRSEWRHRSCQLNRRTPGPRRDPGPTPREPGAAVRHGPWAYRPSLVLAYSRVLSDARRRRPHGFGLQHTMRDQSAMFMLPRLHILECEQSGSIWQLLKNYTESQWKPRILNRSQTRCSRAVPCTIKINSTSELVLTVYVRSVWVARASSPYENLNRHRSGSASGR